MKIYYLILLSVLTGLVVKADENPKVLSKAFVAEGESVLSIMKLLTEKEDISITFVHVNFSVMHTKDKKVRVDYIKGTPIPHLLDYLCKKSGWTWRSQDSGEIVVYDTRWQFREGYKPKKNIEESKEFVQFLENDIAFNKSCPVDVINMLSQDDPNSIGPAITFVQYLNKGKSDYAQITLSYKKGDSMFTVIKDLCKQAGWGFELVNKQIVVFDKKVNFEYYDRYHYM